MSKTKTAPETETKNEAAAQEEKPRPAAQEILELIRARKGPNVFAQEIEGKTYHIKALNFPRMMSVYVNAERLKDGTIAGLIGGRCAALISECVCPEANPDEIVFSLEEAHEITREPNAANLVRELVDAIGNRNANIAETLWGENGIGQKVFGG